MQVIKPMQQGVVFRTFSKGKQFYLSVASLSFFPFHNSQALGTEQQMWDALTATLYDDVIFDSGMPKCQSEVMVAGKCCAPKGEKVTRQYVDLDLGSIQKRLVVTGNRYWTKGNTNENMVGRMLGYDWRASEPEPFEKMDIGWKNAFGGTGFAYNPLGKGHFVKDQSPSYKNNDALPNIEAPKQMMPEDFNAADVYNKWGVHNPCGYGPLDHAWPQQIRKQGKQYDKHWEKELYPGPALDMNPAYYNVAPEDQQLKKSYFSGDEAFSITGMHPNHEIQKSQLPQITPRGFILQKTEEGEFWRELSFTPETVWLFPNIERGILVNRSVIEIDTFYGIDIDTLLLAWELKGGQTRTPKDYRLSLERRENEETSADWMGREDDLSPPEGIPEEEPIFLDEDEEEPNAKFQPLIDRANARVKEYKIWGQTFSLHI